jgi:predicted RNase H-like HicB family nuclease
VHNEFTAIIERDADWFVAYCPEIPGANGQGRTSEEARENLAAAIALILEDRREDALRGVPDGAVRETVVVESPASAAGRRRTGRRDGGVTSAAGVPARW